MTFMCFLVFCFLTYSNYRVIFDLIPCGQTIRFAARNFVIIAVLKSQFHNFNRVTARLCWDFTVVGVLNVLSHNGLQIACCSVCCLDTVLGLACCVGRFAHVRISINPHRVLGAKSTLSPSDFILILANYLWQCEYKSSSTCISGVDPNSSAELFYNHPAE